MIVLGFLFVAVLAASESLSAQLAFVLMLIFYFLFGIWKKMGVGASHRADRVRHNRRAMAGAMDVQIFTAFDAAFCRDEKQLREYVLKSGITFRGGFAKTLSMVSVPRPHAGSKISGGQYLHQDRKNSSPA